MPTDLRFVDADNAVGGITLRDVDGETTATLITTLERPVASAARGRLRVLVVASSLGLAVAFGTFAVWLTANVPSASRCSTVSSTGDVTAARTA